MKHDDLLKIMGADLGISRYRNESDESFGIRTVYSASRFWIEAFAWTMDGWVLTDASPASFHED